MDRASTERLENHAAPSARRAPEQLRFELPGDSPAAPPVRLYEGDCRAVLAEMDDSSVHLVLTDPPYFIHGLDDKWNKDKINHSRSHRAAKAIGGLPIGMQFKPEQGVNLQSFIQPVAEELIRVLKPGGFLLMFSAPRLYHRAAVAVEDAGFEIRDAYAWRYTRRAQFKAFTVDHFVRKRRDMTASEKMSAIQQLDGRRTPQLRPQFEPIVCAQKPREGTFVDNWMKHRTGLIDARQSLTGGAPETVMTVEKENREECNAHLTPKPVRLCEHLIRLFTVPGQVVLDPFVGSGSTCIAAQNAGRYGVGIDMEPEFLDITRKRMEFRNGAALS